MKGFWVSAPVNSRSGYGELARRVIDGMHRAGARINGITNLNWGNCKQISHTGWEDHFRVGKIDPEECRNHLIVGMPQEACWMQTGSEDKTWMITTGLELSTGIPNTEIMDIANLYKTAFTSTRVMKVYLNAAQNFLESPNISFVPAFVNQIGYENWDVDFLVSDHLPEYGHKKIYLAVAQFCPRKNLQFLLDVWRKADIKDGVLVLKTNLGRYTVKEFNHICDRLGVYTIEVEGSGLHKVYKPSDVKNVYILHRELKDDDMEALYCQSHVFVNFSHGEGLNFPELHARKNNLQVISTDGPLGSTLPVHSATIVDRDYLQGYRINPWATWLEVCEEHAIESLRNPPTNQHYPLTYELETMAGCMKGFLDLENE